jgi:hypothetical protein
MRTIESVLNTYASRYLITEGNDDFNPGDHYGHNSDDVFSGGQDAGEIEFARLLLEEFYGKTVTNEDED